LVTAADHQRIGEVYAGGVHPDAHLVRLEARALSLFEPQRVGRAPFSAMDRLHSVFLRHSRRSHRGYRKTLASGRSTGGRTRPSTTVRGPGEGRVTRCSRTLPPGRQRADPGSARSSGPASIGKPLPAGAVAGWPPEGSLIAGPYREPATVAQDARRAIPAPDEGITLSPFRLSGSLRRGAAGVCAQYPFPPLPSHPG
jgi:hypothetical protein